MAPIIRVNNADDLVPVCTKQNGGVLKDAKILWSAPSRVLAQREQELAGAIYATTNVASVSAVECSARGETAVRNLLVILSTPGHNICFNSVKAAITTYLEKENFISKEDFNYRGLNAEGPTLKQVAAELVPIGRLPNIKLPDNPRALCGTYVKKVKGRRPQAAAGTGRREGQQAESSTAATSSGEQLQKPRSAGAVDTYDSNTGSSDDGSSDARAPRKLCVRGSMVICRRGSRKVLESSDDDDEDGAAAATPFTPLGVEDLATTKHDEVKAGAVEDGAGTVEQHTMAVTAQQKQQSTCLAAASVSAAAVTDLNEICVSHQVSNVLSAWCTLIASLQLCLSVYIPS
jgi:hypothetical protein